MHSCPMIANSIKVARPLTDGFYNTIYSTVTCGPALLLAELEILCLARSEKYAADSTDNKGNLQKRGVARA
jgi:hypothetical protein